VQRGPSWKASHRRAIAIDSQQQMAIRPYRGRRTWPLHLPGQGPATTGPGSFGPCMDLTLRSCRAHCSSELPPVWPHPEGDTRAVALSPCSARRRQRYSRIRCSTNCWHWSTACAPAVRATASSRPLNGGRGWRLRVYPDDPNVAMLEAVAESLGPLADRMGNSGDGSPNDRPRGTARLGLPSPKSAGDPSRCLARSATPAGPAWLWPMARRYHGALLE